MKKATLTIDKHEAEIIRRALITFSMTGSSYIFGCPADWSQKVNEYYSVMTYYLDNMINELDKLCVELEKN